MADSCYHCALPVPADCALTVDVDGNAEPVCCPGCKAVAELIRASGLENYYAMREAPEPGVGRPEGDSAEWDAFDRPDMLDAFAERGDATAVVTIYVAGMYCSACSWLIESTLGAMAGVVAADINPVSHRVRVTFDTGRTGLGRLLATLAELGYKPQPLAPESAARPELVEQRMALKRLLVASLGMMQVMMFAIALYAGEFKGIDPAMQRFLRFVSLLVTTPVVFYSARPFFTGAVRGLRARRPGMDLPVSIAIAAAYVASVYATFVNGPAVWFDSVVMFVFFLTVGRYLEMRARHRSIDRSVALSSLLPNTVTRFGPDGREVVPVSRLAAGDRVLVPTGDAVPADGVLCRGTTRLDESVLTGESAPRARNTGDRLLAGSVNLGDSIELEVSATGIDTTLGAIGRLSERARYARPSFVQVADRVASWIVVAILVVAAAVGAAWMAIDPERAFEVTLSVLVVTCPCALALATPAAFAAAGSRLAELKLLVTNGNAIEALARADRILFDKTGTLTFGRPVIAETRVVDERFDETRCRQIAAALEADSSHPVAAAFASDVGDVVVDAHRTVVGQGLSATIDGAEWRIGRPQFVAPGRTFDADDEALVWLGTDGELVAGFRLEDALRPDAEDTLAELRDLGLEPSLLSGDSAAAVAATAARLGIDDARYGCSPEDKLDAIRARQADGHIVVMVGDGINDAPVLAGADVSIAPAHAARLAQTSADVILLGESLRPVLTVLGMAKRTMRIVRQNLAWAIVYNALALPVAALGLVPPWAAAIGMSASSLIVVLNALRLGAYGMGDAD